MVKKMISLGSPAAFSRLLILVAFVRSSAAFAADLEKTGVPEIKGRALEGANATQLVGALDDVSIDEEHQEECVEGQIVDRGCEERCKCIHGSLGCAPRCPLPLLKSGTPSGDPDCFLQPVQGDECCATLVCSSEAESESINGCSHKNQTYKMGQMFHDGCLATCFCHENGVVNCTARCPHQNGTSSDNCLSVEDPKDPCCSILYCDVNTGDELAIEDDIETPKLVSAVPANSSTAMLNFDKLSVVERVNAEFSTDQKMWKQAKTIGEAVVGLEPGKTYYFRVTFENGQLSNVVSATLPNLSTNGTSCEFKGKTYKIGEEFHDDCIAYCVCSPSGVECAPINCPTDFGLDVLDPTCLEWETVPSGFKPSPPHCCPQSLICKNNGSCVYQGVLFENWQDIPDQLSGCKEKCFCSSGNVTCRQRCPTIPKTPPVGLSCSPKQPILGHPPGEECCLAWICPMIQETVVVHHIEAVDEGTVRLIFSVPEILVGLHGRIELRYTSELKNNDPSTWEQQVLAPLGDMIATPELEFELKGLQPDTEYKIKITVVGRGLSSSPTSQIYVAKTLPTVKTTTLPPIIPVEPTMRVTKVNSTWATLEWRKFSEYELQFIDGVQLRYKELDGKVYQATPLIHRAVTSYTIEDLKPDSKYEIGIFFIPFPDQSTELQAQKTVFLNTTIENDPYKFLLTLEIHHIKTSSVELTWSGVPYPEDKYVNIFRAIYQYDGGREDMSTFKVAKRDSPMSTLITGLKPETRYRLWLEAYLTNGRIKKSNVKDFTTKVKVYNANEVAEGKLEGTLIQQETNYYGPLVGVSVLAAITSLVAIILLVIIAKKHGHNKAPITAAIQRKSTPHSAAYDNPSYKAEVQHETMDL